jgi:alcohol dehydrogenase
MAKPDQEFQIAVPTRIIFGAGVSRDLGTLLFQRGYRSVMVCTDVNLVKAGVLQGVESCLQAAKVGYFIYDQVKQNPDLEMVLAGKKLAQGRHIDCVVGVGGGGPIDVAKAMSVALTHTGDIRDYIAYTTGQKKPIDGKLLPIVAVPTTAGSGAEVSPVAVIVDKEIRTKIGFFSERLMPELAVVDPALSVTLPPGPTAGAGLDVFAHAFDAFVSRKATLYTDALAKGAMETVFRHLRTAVWQGDDLQARSAMSAASIMALLAIYLGRGGAVHTIGEPLGTMYDLPHGYACGIAIPAMMKYVLPVCRGQLAQIHALCGSCGYERREAEDPGSACIAAMKRLIRETGLPAPSTAVSKPDIEKLSEASAAHLAVDRVPMPISRQDYIKLYAEIFSDGYLEETR